MRERCSVRTMTKRQANALSIMEGGFPVRAEKGGNRKNDKTKSFFPMVHLSVYAFKQRLRKARRLLQQYSDSSYPHPYTSGCNHSGRLPVPQTRFVSVTTDGNHSCCQMVHLPLCQTGCICQTSVVEDTCP